MSEREKNISCDHISTVTTTKGAPIRISGVDHPPQKWSVNFRKQSWEKVNGTPNWSVSVVSVHRYSSATWSLLLYCYFHLRQGKIMRATSAVKPPNSKYFTTVLSQSTLVNVFTVNLLCCHIKLFMFLWTETLRPAVCLAPLYAISAISCELSWPITLHDLAAVLLAGC